MNVQKAILMLVAVLAGLSAMGAGAKAGGNAAQTNTNFLSVFTIPASLSEGRDPFFPESTRVIDAMMASKQAKQAGPAAEISALKVLGISGSPGHLLAIINNHTFAAGDEGEVSTSSGKLQIRCLEVGNDHVNVMVNGQYHQLKLQQN